MRLATLTGVAFFALFAGACAGSCKSKEEDKESQNVQDNKPHHWIVPPSLHAPAGEEFRYQMRLYDDQCSSLAIKVHQKPETATISKTGLLTWTPQADELPQKVTVEAFDRYHSALISFQIHEGSLQQSNAIKINDLDYTVSFDRTIGVITHREDRLTSLTADQLDCIVRKMEQQQPYKRELAILLAENKNDLNELEGSRTFLPAKALRAIREGLRKQKAALINILAHYQREAGDNSLDITNIGTSQMQITELKDLIHNIGIQLQNPEP